MSAPRAAVTITSRFNRRRRSVILATFTVRGQAWTSNCREWVYFDCYIDLADVRERVPLADCVENHIHRGMHDGQECGFVCSICHDAVMGRYEPGPNGAVFRG